MTASVIVPWFAVLGYAYIAAAVVNTEQFTGMGAVSAAGLLVLCTATVATQIADAPFTWILSVRDPAIPIRLLALMASFPFLIAVVRRVLIPQGVDERIVPVYSTLAGTLLIGAAVLALSRREERLLETSEADRALLRATSESAAVGMCLVDPAGRFISVNPAVCRFFGYDRHTLLGKTWQELTTEQYRQADLQNVADILAGRIESYRMKKQYIHADGHPIWGDLSVGCVRGSDGQVRVLTAQIVDIDDEVRAQRLLTESDARNRALAMGLQNDLDSALRYVRSVLPDDLSGPVRTCSTYLPARSVGGDVFDFFWCDEDQLVVYLLDVAGHGVGPALVAVSVQHMIRAFINRQTAPVDPDRVLTELNSHFCSRRDDEHYLTIWFGIYRRSTAGLRYAGGGHPPALLFAGGRPRPLPSQGPPVGLLDDVRFTTETVPLSPGDTLLVYSDGVYERRLPGGLLWSLEEFVDTCTRLSGAPGSSCGDLIAALPPRNGEDDLDDDTTMVRLTFEPTVQFAERP